MRTITDRFSMAAPMGLYNAFLEILSEASHYSGCQIGDDPRIRFHQLIEGICVADGQKEVSYDVLAFVTTVFHWTLSNEGTNPADIALIAGKLLGFRENDFRVTTRKGRGYFLQTSDRFARKHGVRFMVPFAEDAIIGFDEISLVFG